MDVRGPADSALDAGLRVLGVVDAELGTSWSEAALAPNGVVATYRVTTSEADVLRVRRWELLSAHIDGVVSRHRAHIDERRDRAILRRHSATAIRTWNAAVRDHVTAVRARFPA